MSTAKNKKQTSKVLTDNSPEPPPNITPNTNSEEKRKKKVSFVTASMIDDTSEKKRYEILVEQRSTPTLQTAVKKTVAILMAQAGMIIYPHSTVTLRNPVNEQGDFPIEQTAIKDYIFDTGTEFRNGLRYYKASFLGTCNDSIQNLKRKGLLSILRQKKIFIQEFDSTEVFESTEIGFLCNLPPNYCARGQIVEELKYFLKGELGKEINLKVKLTSRYFGNKKEGLVKSQYLTLYAETKYYQEAGECIGEALEDGIILRKWGNIKLLPTKPTLHDKYNKEKFFQVLQIHNEAIRNTERIAIRNVWVGDHVLPNNDSLLESLSLSLDRDYTLRELIMESATENDVDIKDIYSNGHMSFVICEKKSYTRTCEFVDFFIEQCKQKYGEIQFAELVKSSDPYDKRYHPRRAEQPVYTSGGAVQNMIDNVNPGIKLLKKKEAQQKIYTSHKQEKTWKSVVISATAHESQTSPLTTDTNSKIETLRGEVQELKKLLFQEKERNMKKQETINANVEELRVEIQKYRKEHENLLMTVQDAVLSMTEALNEIRKTNRKTTEFEQRIQKHLNIIGKPLDESPNNDNFTPNKEIQDVRMSEQVKRSHTDRIIEEENLSPKLHTQPTRNKVENRTNEHKRLFMKHGHSTKEGHVNK